MDRGYGLDLETVYGDKSKEIKPKFWDDAESLDFKLNDEPITKNGSSRMAKWSRVGYMKPTGSIDTFADLERLTWYFRGFLDHYKYTPGNNSSNAVIPVNLHEYYGGEDKDLQSFSAIVMFDMLKKYIYGLLLDELSLEVEEEEVKLSSEWIYKTEKSGIIGENGESFIRPDDIAENEYFLTGYDVYLEMNNKPLNGISSSFSFSGKNNLNVDATIGLGSRYPQRKAMAGARENELSFTTYLTKETVRDILDAQYGEVGALEPSRCKLLNVSLKLVVDVCEDSSIGLEIYFPKCTLSVEYNMSEADEIETTINLQTLGHGKATTVGFGEVETDMYVKLTNHQTECNPIEG